MSPGASEARRPASAPRSWQAQASSRVSESGLRNPGGQRVRAHRLRSAQAESGACLERERMFSGAARDPVRAAAEHAPRRLRAHGSSSGAGRSSACESVSRRAARRSISGALRARLLRAERDIGTAPRPAVRSRPRARPGPIELECVSAARPGSARSASQSRAQRAGERVHGRKHGSHGHGPRHGGGGFAGEVARLCEQVLAEARSAARSSRRHRPARCRVPGAQTRSGSLVERSERQPRLFEGPVAVGARVELGRVLQRRASIAVRGGGEQPAARAGAARVRAERRCDDGTVLGAAPVSSASRTAAPACDPVGIRAGRLPRRRGRGDAAKARAAAEIEVA